MTREQLLDLLAQHRQMLDTTARGITPELAAEYDLGRRHLGQALYHLGEALLAFDTPSVTPAQPWLTSPLPERLPAPTYTTGL